MYEHVKNLPEAFLDKAKLEFTQPLPSLLRAPLSEGGTEEEWESFTQELISRATMRLTTDLPETPPGWYWCLEPFTLSLEFSYRSEVEMKARWILKRIP